MAAKRAYAAILLPTGYVYEYLNDNGNVTARAGFNNYSLWSGTGFTAIPAISGPAGTTTTVTLGGLDNTDRVALNVASEATSGIQGSTGRPYFWTQGNAPTPASYHYSLPLPSTAPSPKPTPQRQDQGIGLSAFGDNVWCGWESASTFYNGGESPSFGSAVNNGALYGEEYFFHNSDYTLTPNDGPRPVNAEMVTAVNKAGAAAGIKTVQGSGGRSTNYTYLSHGPFDTGFFEGGGTFDFHPEKLDVAGNAFGKSFIFGNTDMWSALRDGTQGGVKIPGINRFYAMNEKRQAVSDDLWTNFKKYPLKDLLPGTIDGQTVNSVSGSKINNNGVILATINLGGTFRSALLVPVEIKVTNRDDLKKKWTDAKYLSLKKAVYAGETTGDMVSWKIAGPDAWSTATYTWTAEWPGEQAIIGPTGAGESEWKIADGDDEVVHDWIDWKPGKWKIKCTIAFAGNSVPIEFEQEIGWRTEDYVVIGQIVATNAHNGDAPSVAETPEFQKAVVTDCALFAPVAVATLPVLYAGTLPNEPFAIAEALNWAVFPHISTPPGPFPQSILGLGTVTDPHRFWMVQVGLNTSVDAPTAPSSFRTSDLAATITAEQFRIFHHYQVKFTVTAAGGIDSLKLVTLHGDKPDDAITGPTKLTLLAGHFPLSGPIHKFKLNFQQNPARTVVLDRPARI